MPPRGFVSRQYGNALAQGRFQVAPASRVSTPVRLGLSASCGNIDRKFAIAKTRSPACDAPFPRQGPKAIEYGLWSMSDREEEKTKQDEHEHEGLSPENERLSAFQALPHSALRSQSFRFEVSEVIGVALHLVQRL